MILKAYITEIPQKGDNRFKVRIPFMEDNTTNEMIFDALLCNQPGEYYGYNVGDCVFVSFENEKLNTAIIFGKLYIDEEETPNYHILNELNVTSKVTLPEDTKIGSYSANDIFKLYQSVDNLYSGAVSTVDSNLLYEIVREWT